MSDTKFELDDLPNEIQLIIVMYLPLEDYYNILLSSKKLNRIGNSEPMRRRVAMNLTLLDRKFQIIDDLEDMLKCYDVEGIEDLISKIKFFERVRKFSRRRNLKNVKSNTKSYSGKELQKLLEWTYSSSDTELAKGWILKPVIKYRKNFDLQTKSFSLTQIEMNKVSYGFRPMSQDDKWHICMEAHERNKKKKKKIVFEVSMVRSWTGVLQYLLKFERVGDVYRLVEIVFEEEHFLSRNVGWMEEENSKYSLSEDFGVICMLIERFTDSDCPHIHPWF